MMEQRLRLRLGRHGLDLLVLSLGGISIVSVIDPWPTLLPIPRVAGPATAIVLFGGWVGVWLLVRGLYDRWRWRRIGAAVGLTPEGGGLLSRAELTGRIGGRQVRAVAGDDHETVLTELPAVPTAGAIVGDLDAAYSRLELAAHADHTEGDLAALASEPGLAETLVTGSARDALAASAHTLAVFAGNVPDAVHAWDAGTDLITYENGDSQKIRHDTPTWDIFADRSADKPGGTMLTDTLTTGGRQTVACVKLTTTEGRIGDDQELRARAEAATAVADAFEAATAVSDATEGP